jgi:thiol-disulfide isomerase/thioredoxin
MADPTESTGPGAAAPRSLGVRVLLVAVAALALLAVLWPRDSARSRKPGGFPIDEAGRPLALARELAPVTLVHFWASWCPPCVTELPELLDFSREAASDRFKVLFIAVGDDPEAARRFVRDPDQAIFFDPGWQVANRFGTERLPESHLVVGGEVVDTFVGETNWSDAAVRRRIQKWTATPTSAAP